MEINYDEKKVSIENAENWTYELTTPATTCTQLKALNFDLYEKIQKQVENYIENKEKIDAENKAKEEALILEKNTKLVEEFKNDFLNNHGKTFKDLKVEFATPSTNSRFDYRVVKVYTGKNSYDYFEIKYNNQVYSSGSWGSHTTSSPWTVVYDYKTRRYATLDKAVKSVAKRIVELKEQFNFEKIQEQKLKTKEIKMEEFALDAGMGFSKNWHSYSSAYNRNRTGGYYTYNMNKNGIFAELAYNKETSEVYISSYKVNKKTSVDVVKQLVLQTKLEGD